MLPTPTPFPDATPQVIIDYEGYRLWAFSDEAIQVWNYHPHLGLIVQVMLIVIFVVIFVILMISLIQSMMSEE